MNIFSTLIFKMLYFLRICPIFVGSLHNFGWSDGHSLMMISSRWLYGFMPNLHKIYWIEWYLFHTNFPTYVEWTKTTIIRKVGNWIIVQVYFTERKSWFMALKLIQTKHLSKLQIYKLCKWSLKKPIAIWFTYLHVMCI